MVPLARPYLVGGSSVGSLWGRARLELHGRPGAKQTARARSLKAEAIYDGDPAVRALQMVHGCLLFPPACVSRPAAAVLDLELPGLDHLLDLRRCTRGTTPRQPRAEPAEALAEPPMDRAAQRFMGDD